MITRDHETQGGDVYGRLDELTAIKNDFAAEIGRQPGPGYGGGPRREQLGRDHNAVMHERGEEIARLWKEEGKDLAEISKHLDQTDPTREAQHDPEAGS